MQFPRKVSVEFQVVLKLYSRPSICVIYYGHQLFLFLVWMDLKQCDNVFKNIDIGAIIFGGW